MKGLKGVARRQPSMASPASPDVPSGATLVGAFPALFTLLLLLLLLLAAACVGCGVGLGVGEGL